MAEYDNRVNETDDVLIKRFEFKERLPVVGSNLINKRARLRRIKEKLQRQRYNDFQNGRLADMPFSRQRNRKS